LAKVYWDARIFLDQFHDRLDVLGKPESDEQRAPAK